MADDTGALCNSTKNHLQLALEQPSKYADDIEAGGTFPDTDEENFDDNEEDKGIEEVDGENKDKDSKIPAIYQVKKKKSYKWTFKLFMCKTCVYVDMLWCLV